MTQPSASIIAPPRSPRRDAVIVLPAIVEKEDFSIWAVARRLALAMDNNARAQASFRVTDSRSIQCHGRQHAALTIYRNDHGDEQPVVDVYEFDYHHALTGLQARKTPLQQVLAMAITLLFAFPGLLRALRRPSQRLVDKLQVWCGALLFGVIVVYFAALIWTVLSSVLMAPAAPWYDALVKLEPRFVPQLDTVKTALVTLTLLALGTRLNLRATLAKVAPALSCSVDYMAAGKRRNQIIGELARLLDYLDEQSGTEYRRVHLLTYSFGSVIALDALFPREVGVIRRLQRVDGLITIGCPFDFIRTYWPSYFNRRHAGAAPRRWFNVYCELDIFGSNFLDETSPTRRAQGVNLIAGEARRPTHDQCVGPTKEQNGSFLDYVRLIGFRAHSVYWDRDSEQDISCFDPIVKYLWPDHESAQRHSEVA